MKRSIIPLVVAGLLSVSVVAEEMDTNNEWKDKAKDGWIDGKAEATLLFNTSFNSFDINTDVKNGIVILTGKVDSEIEKKLAEELVVGIDGVQSVDNKLTVVEDRSMVEDEKAMDKLTDAKIATVVKTRLLLDGDVPGFGIDVDVENRKVSLKGEVKSEAERKLAVQIARNTADVSDVEDNLMVVEPR